MTLILSSSDFLIEDNDGGTTWTSISGTAVLHSDVTNDVSYDSGSIASSSYCRCYDPNGATNLLYTTVSSSVGGGEYVGPFGDNAISVRAWIYVNNVGANHRSSLVIKNGQALLGSQDCEGYFLELDINILSLGAKSGSTGVDKDTVLSGQFSSETWYRIRLDYVPIGTLKDVLYAYTASAGVPNNLCHLYSINE